MFLSIFEPAIPYQRTREMGSDFTSKFLPFCAILIMALDVFFSHAQQAYTVKIVELVEPLFDLLHPPSHAQAFWILHTLFHKNSLDAIY